MSSTKTFSLANKGLKLNSAEDLEPLIGPLIASNEVEEVKFLGNTLGIGACQRLGEVLSTKETLKNADFSDIYTGRLLSEIPKAISALLDPLIGLKNLKTINLNDNAFGRNVVESILPFLSGHTPLQHLYLNNNGLGPDAGRLVANALSDLHAKKVAARKDGVDVPDLETIVCGRNRLESGSMKAWALTIGLHNKIKTLRMVQNGIRPDGLAAFFRYGVSSATELRILDLNDNTLTVLASKELARILPTLTNLVELNIGDAVLSNKGGSAIFRALGRGKNVKLEKLSLQYGEINTNGLKKLVAAVEAVPLLRKIELNGNKFSEEDESLEPLRELLEKRKKKLAGDDAHEGAWGLDELDEMEYDSDEPLESDEDVEKSEEEKEEENDEAPISKEPEKDQDVLGITETLKKVGI